MVSTKSKDFGKLYAGRYHQKKLRIYQSGKRWEYPMPINKKRNYLIKRISVCHCMGY